MSEGGVPGSLESGVGGVPGSGVDGGVPGSGVGGATEGSKSSELEVVVGRGEDEAIRWYCERTKEVESPQESCRGLSVEVWKKILESFGLFSLKKIPRFPELGLALCRGRGTAGQSTLLKLLKGLLEHKRCGSTKKVEVSPGRRGKMWRCRPSRTVGASRGTGRSSTTWDHSRGHCSQPGIRPSNRAATDGVVGSRR